MNQQQLDKLEAAYSSGILEVREDDTWLKFNSMRDMRVAIREAKIDIANANGLGTRLVSTSKGYN